MQFPFAVNDSKKMLTIETRVVSLQFGAQIAR
jgi:hypothetical protein